METVAEKLYNALKMAKATVEFTRDICSNHLSKKLVIQLREIDHALKAYENHLAIERHNRNVVDLVNKAMEVR